MNLPEVRMRVLKRRRDPAAVNSRLIRRPIQRMFWLFLLPMTAAFCIGFVYPFLKGLFLSFCKFKTTSKWTWVGLSNYVKAFHDESFLYSFGYTAVFAIVVSGYSGGDIVACQAAGAMNMNKGFWLPANFCLLETANDKGEALALPGIQDRADRFAENMLCQLAY